MSGYEDSKPEVGTILNDYVQNEYKLSMWIPKDLGGKVIGKRGVVITNLQRETKAKQINALQPVGNSLWIAVVILGGYKNIIAAYNSISEIVDDEVDGVVLEFMINYKKPFFLYGPKKFGIIKRLSAETNVRIFFPEFNVKEQNFSEALPVSLEGECVDVQRAVVELEKEAVLYRAAMNLKYGSSRTERDERYEERDSTRHTVVHVPVTSADRDVSNLAQSLRAGARVTSREPPRLIDTKALGNSGNLTDSPVPTPNSATKAQRIFELVGQTQQQTAAKTSSRSVETDEYEQEEQTTVRPTRKFEKSVEVPSTLVGLLLSKKPRTKITTLNVMQSMTHTIISKIINPDTIQEVVVVASEEKERGGRRRRAVSDDENSHDEDSDSSSVNADSRPARKGPARVTHTYVNDENIFVTFKVLGWTEDAVDMVIDHLQRIIDGDRIKEVMDDLRHAARSLPHKPPRQTAPVYGYHKEEATAPPVPTQRVRVDKERSSRPAPRYTEVSASESAAGAILSAVAPGDRVYEGKSRTTRPAGPRGLVVNAPDDSAPQYESRDVREHREPRERREDREPRAGGFVKHTAEGAIFGGPAPLNRGGRGGGRGRADFAGGRGRDFGKDIAAAPEPREGGRGGRGAGRGGGRGRGRGRGGDSPPRERTEGW